MGTAMGEIRDINGDAIRPVGKIALPEPAPVGQTGWKCLPCVVDRKVAEIAGYSELPVLRDGITMVSGQPVCYDHVTVARQSPLAMPNGQQVTVPPRLMNGHS